MKVLHLCSDYSRQKLYARLITHLSFYCGHQTVYIPVRTQEEIGKYDITNPKIDLYYSFILKKIHRYLFGLKIQSVSHDLNEKINVEKYDLIHAHFLFSDGAVALKQKARFGIPYIVSVRNTDVNYFFKYLIHTRKKGLEVLRQASSILFLTPAYVNLLINNYVPEELHTSIRKKISIIPNGLEQHWFEPSVSNSISIEHHFKLLYVGDFTPNKNIGSVIAAVKVLNSNGLKCSLTIVGGGGKNSDKMEKQITKSSDKIVRYLGKIKDQYKLKEVYSDHHVFVMPSFKETFGMVYLEAMSQGLPVIYSRGQGIDGYFGSNKPGVAVNAENHNELIHAIEKIYSDYKSYRQNALKEVERFKWTIIAENISKQYNIVVQ